jgi:uncharacterized sodium:solute symporter family permease YidK
MTRHQAAAHVTRHSESGSSMAWVPVAAVLAGLLVVGVAWWLTGVIGPVVP